ncbi:hypothetical protein RHMOL_Rhmol09G0073000 [Rhododendron molle]|uniref:Uncharacterized protein n=1 Tax=Rhododendron molle TaxID=49168 RepID=A0ACC0MBV1_RHOML|nr:hypothetical protein RHMOL_Rhmol09G0073000 [Rhododendron molle]
MSGAENNSSRKRPLEHPSSASTLSVKVKSQDGIEVFFSIKRSTVLKKLLVAYCQKRNFDYKTMEFLYNGDRFSHNRSAEDLNMDEEDEIDAMWHQEGGGCVRN